MSYYYRVANIYLSFVEAMPVKFVKLRALEGLLGPGLACYHNSAVKKAKCWVDDMVYILY